MNTRKKNHVIRYLPLMICLLWVVSLPGKSAADFIRIKGTVVNVRQGPGTTHPVLFQAQQGEEFDLISTEGLWCLVQLPTGREAWVYRKLVDIVEGQRPGSESGIPDSEKPDVSSAESGWSWIAQAAFILFAFLLASVGIWKRREIVRFTGVKLREISGYKRDQAFRYDNRKPSDDSWEL